MNSQTPGPLFVGLHSRIQTLKAPANGRILADLTHSDRRDLPTEAALFAAAYSAFDRAGRELGVDAVELARSVDIAALIRERDQAREALEACRVFVTPLERLKNWNEHKQDAADRIRTVIGVPR